MIVNICGILHEVVEKADNFNIDTHFGQIDHAKAEISINKDMAERVKIETICHEMVHGILLHIGRLDLNGDEVFVQALSNAIFQGFTIKEV